MDKIYIVDAVNTLFRSYYAIGPMMNEKGESTGALFGFIRSMMKLIHDFAPEHLVCVFDGPDNKRSRKALYSEYKMHRKGAPEDLFPQFDWAYEYCEKRGIPLLCVDGVEADDTMASIALWAKKKGAEVYLISSDKDLMQLVDEKVFLLQPHKNNLIIDAKKVEELFSVRPDQMLDYLALVGDTSDNIPGVAGFGPKTASSLLQEFGTLDALLKHPEKIAGEKKRQGLIEGKKEALLSRELATLDVKVEIPHNEEFYRLGEGDKKELISFFHAMHFNSLLKEVGEVPAPKKGKDEKGTYHLIESIEALKELLKKVGKAKEIGIDTETDRLEPMLADLVGISFCVEPKEAWYVPLNGNIEREVVIEQLKHFFSATKSSFYGHNLKYDLHILANLGIALKKISFDTILASYLLTPQNRKHNLDDLCLERFKKVKIPLESLIGKGKSARSMLEVPVKEVAEYCCEDVDYTARLKELFQEELKERGLKKLFEEVELPLLPVLAKMERTGIYLNVEKLKEVEKRTKKELERVKGKIFEAVGEEFNLNSPKQLSEVLFEKMKLPMPGRKKSAFSTSADILEELAKESPFVEQILIYRGLEKLRSTYIEALPEAVHPRTGRIHSTFNQSVAATGRLSSQDPNLQNIPARSVEGEAIRSCFEAEKRGWSLLSGDYSQIELRLLAHFSEDPELIRAFRSGEDIHQFTASLVFGVALKEVTPEMRQRAKTVNFGILYGQGPYALSRQLGISFKEASSFIETYFERYPKVRDYLEGCKEEVRQKGMSTTLTGRQRPIPEIHNQNAAIRAGAERLAINTPLQGSAADLIKMAMIEIDEEIEKQGLEGRMILQVHDELVFEIPDREIVLFETLVKEKMEGVIALKVPLKIEVGVGKNWAEC